MKHNYPEDINQMIEEIKRKRFTDPQSVITLCNSILEYAQLHNDTYLISYAYLYIGDAYLTLGKLSESIPKLMIAASYQETHRYFDLLVKTYNILAITYYNQGDELLSLDTYYKGLRIANRNQDYVMLGMLYNNIGTIYLDYKDYPQAMKYFKKSVTMSRKCPDAESHNITKVFKYINYSICQLSQGNIKKASEYLHKLEKNLTTEENKSEYYSICSIRCNLYMKKNQSKEAAEIGHYIADLPLHEIERLESFIDFIEILDVLIDLKQYKDAKILINKLTFVVTHEPTPQRWLTLINSEIKYFKAVDDQTELLKCYQKYYEQRKAWLSEVKSSIITAIDNRLYLEEEYSENKRLESDNKKLSDLSEKDHLTGLANRYGWKHYYQSHFASAKTKQEKFGLMILDIDCLKQYNDTYGHPMGDLCIQQVASCIRQSVPSNYLTARYGGDEFFIASVNTPDQELQEIATKILAAVKDKQLVLSKTDSQTHYVSVTIGIINAVPSSGQTIADFIHGADTALYQIKETTKNNYCFSTMI